MAETTFSLLHFNAWMIRILGVPWSHQLEERLEVLPRCLAEENPDVISLVEVWSNRDKKRLADSLKRYGYLYSTYSTHRFGLGDGLFLASRHPIVESHLSKPFSTCTTRLERFAAKRAMRVRIELPEIGPVTVFSTHLGSPHYDSKNRRYCERSRGALRTQMRELCSFVRGHTKDDRYFFLAGDLNIHYQADSGPSEEYSNVLHPCGLANSFLLANGLSETDPPHRATTYSQKNPYVAQAGFGSLPEETLDYILFCPRRELRVTESQVVLREIEDRKLRHLSDHYGVKSTFVFEQPKTSLVRLLRAVPVSRVLEAQGAV